jgi:hypothetical protein
LGTWYIEKIRALVKLHKMYLNSEMKIIIIIIILRFLLLLMDYDYVCGELISGNT